MLNKELLMAGSEQSQRKVVLTISKAAFFSGYSYGYTRGLMDEPQLNVLPYWGTTDNALEALVHFDSLNTSIFRLDKDTEVTVFVEGYSTSLHNGNPVKGDPYDMRNSEGSTRYLTFDPPPDGYLDPKTQTDLGIGYYVEEAPWEAQDAEQGASYGCR